MMFPDDEIAGKNGRESESFGHSRSTETAVSILSTTAIPSEDATLQRVIQAQKGYLNAIYATDYFREVTRRIASYARHFDFIIGLGAALSGGTGLGILANPSFAWLCGIITTASIILTVAKSSYDWPGKLKNASEMLERYGRLSGMYKILIDELNYKQKWSDEFEEIFRKLQAEELSFNREDFESLPLDTQRKIQENIKKRIDYKHWWRPT